MYKNGVSLTTAEVETDGGNQTKEMTKAEDKNTENANTEKSSNSATREKAEEPERVQVELKETERSSPGGRPGHLLTRSKPTLAEAHHHWKILGEVGPERPIFSTSNNIVHP
ncbi:hypothetical protein M9H77_05154 [Catharanthus roseus]|uniref:Uncharacterized protein n=1 Tax=Catharanthus roseus TaxID=4058 RepID=A0ACC0CG97_CATRO|nr:hypothetical protein M9H77_05154 [Catharanthus roseus]